MKLGAALRRAAVFAVLIVIAVWLALARSADGPPPDDADLRVATARPEDFANAQLTLSSAAALFVRDDAEAQWERLARGEAWDDAVVANSLAANETALQAFARAARQTTFASRGDEMPAELLAWIDLARLQGMRAISLARAGDANGAIEAALVGLRVARVTASGAIGSRLLREVAAAMHSASLAALREVLRSVVLTPEASAQLASQLAALHADANSIRAQLAGEYRAFATAAPPRVDIDLSAQGAALRWLAGTLPASHRNQPNNMLALYARAARSEIEAASEPCGSSAPAQFHASLRGLLTPNAEGRLHIDEVGMLNEIRRTACRADTQLEAVRAALGVQRFERERGALPPAIEALVPAYLSDLPLDRFSGEALRLDRAARELVSVGVWDAEPGAPPREERFALLPAPPAS